MTFDEFEASAWSTFGGVEDNPREQLMCSALGLAGETAEYVELLKNVPLSRHQAMLELGDILFYVAISARVLGVRMEDLPRDDDIVLGDLRVEAGIMPAAVRLLIVIGTYADAIKKACFHGHSLDMAHVTWLLGEALSEMTTACVLLGITMEDVAFANQAKLQARYPDGFSVARSHHRKEVS